MTDYVDRRHHHRHPFECWRERSPVQQCQEQQKCPPDRLYDETHPICMSPVKSSRPSSRNDYAPLVQDIMTPARPRRNKGSVGDPTKVRDAHSLSFWNALHFIHTNVPTEQAVVISKGSVVLSNWSEIPITSRLLMIISHSVELFSCCVPLVP